MIIKKRTYATPFTCFYDSLQNHKSLHLHNLVKPDVIKHLHELEIKNFHAQS